MIQNHSRLPVEIMPPGAFASAPRANDVHAEARALWTRWNSGVSAGTMAARRSDLAGFGAHAWRSRNEFTVIRRVIATLASDRAELRALAEAWHAYDRDRGAAPGTLRRRWSSLKALVFAIAKHSREPQDLGAMPRADATEIDSTRRDAIVHDAITRARWNDAAIVGVIGTLGLSDAVVAKLRCSELLVHARACSLPIQRAAEKVCEGRPARSLAFGGRRRGDGLSRTGVCRACERWSTTAAALRRLAERERKESQC